MSTNEREIIKVYANHMEATGGAFDVVLEFGTRQGDGEADIATSVVMSWEHAAAIVQVLQRLIERYEDDVGPIRKDLGSATVQESA